MIEQPVDDDVAALDQADARRRVELGDLGHDARHPGPAGIDERPRDDLALKPGVDIERGEAPGFVVALGGDAAGAGVDGGAAFGGVDGVQDDEAGIIDPAVGIFETAREFRLERQPRRVRGEIERAGRRQDVAAAKMVIEEQAEPQHRPGRRPR